MIAVFCKFFVRSACHLLPFGSARHTYRWVPTGLFFLVGLLPLHLFCRHQHHLPPCCASKVSDFAGSLFCGHRYVGFLNYIPLWDLFRTCLHDTTVTWLAFPHGLCYLQLLLRLTITAPPIPHLHTMPFCRTLCLQTCFPPLPVPTDAATIRRLPAAAAPHNSFLRFLP